MPRATKPIPTAADALDQLRDLVEQDGRPIAEIAESCDPPMGRTNLHGVLSGARRTPSIETVARILAGLGRSWADLD